MAKPKKKEGSPVTLEALRDNSVAIGLAIKSGEITPTVGNAVINAYRNAIYAETSRLNRDKDKPVEVQQGVADLSQEAKDRLDEIIRQLKDVDQEEAGDGVQN